MTQEQTIYKDKPLQLIMFDGPKFTLNEEAMEVIRSIKDEIIIISIVGKARTGKSFLMNSLLELNGKRTGFEVSSSINSCTKGIWIWGNVKKKQNSNAKILFLDSEGTSSYDRSTRTYDSKIFALVVLISSLFLYNTTSNIDEQGISELSLAAHLSNSIAISANAASSIDENHRKDLIISELSPKFIWILRDFSLEKIHPDTDEEITSKEYLELCLNKKLAGKNANENNIIRENIVKYFRDRDCFTLPRPIDREEDLKDLNNIPFDSLNSEFKTDFLSLKQEVLKNSQSKKFKGKRLTGQSLYELIKLFVNSINEGIIPNILNAWETVIVNDIKEHYEKANRKLKLEESQFDRFLSEYSLKKNDFEGKYKYLSVLKEVLRIKKEVFFVYSQILMSNKDSFIMNKTYMSLYEEKKSQILLDINKFTLRMINSYNDLTEKSNLTFFSQKTKEIDRKSNDRYFAEKNYMEIIESEEEAYNNLKQEFNGGKSVETFVTEMIKLHIRVIKSVESNIHLFYNQKSNEKKKEEDNLKFEFDTETQRLVSLKERYETQENRLKNKLSDKELNNKEIKVLEERLKEIQERIKIKKESHLAKVERKRQEEQLEKERKMKEEFDEEQKRLENERIEKEKQKEKDELEIVKPSKKDNKSKFSGKANKGGCGCACLVY